MDISTYPLVSVIIPVFNDEVGLQLCLDALAGQTYPRSRYEIIVVDNGSDDIYAIKSWVDAHENLTLAHEATPGSYAARNRGIALARGDVLAFTDADCIPDDGWLMAGVTSLTASPNAGLVGGQIQTFLQNPGRPTAVELYESIRALPQQEFIHLGHFAATANLFTYRQVFDIVGLFDSSLKSSGDLEWGQRVYQAGYSQAYSEAAIVRHPVHTSLRSFCTRTQRVMGGRYDLQMKLAQTFWQRQLVFLRGVVLGLVPYIGLNDFMGTLRSDPRIAGTVPKLKVISILALSRCVSILEIFRLKMGGLSKRA